MYPGDDQEVVLLIVHFFVLYVTTRLLEHYSTFLEGYFEALIYYSTARSRFLCMKTTSTTK